MRVKPRPNGKYLTLRQAEAEYGLAYATMYRWVREGRLPFLSGSVVGRVYLFRRADLEKFLEENTTEVSS
jgi:excisionase family DNA binding protein